MRYLFAPAQTEMLRTLAAGRLLVALDFDGTLAPIVADRDAAALRPDTAALLAAVAARYPCAVVSGRARRDVAARVRAAGVRRLVGNHGLEPGPRARLAAAAAATRRAVPLLAAALADRPGVELEDKRYSLAIHHRGVRHPRAARAAIVAAIDALPIPMRIVLGDAVVNVVPAHAPHKGDAVLALRAGLHADAVLYVGDDVTDEDVFALDTNGRLRGAAARTGGPAADGLGDPDRLVTVRIGASARSAARYYVRDQREIDRLLQALVTLRPAPLATRRS